MLKALAKNIKDKNDIDVDVIGFSRGAVTAVAFAETLQKLIDENVFPYCKIKEIRFMGLYDPVPGPYITKKPKIPKIASNVSIAYSLDEKRNEFKPFIYSGNRRAFRGGHSDIGGGYKNRGLANITLEWMIKEGQNAHAPFKMFYPGGSSLLVRHQETAWYYTWLGDGYSNRSNIGGIPNHPSISRLKRQNAAPKGLDLSKAYYTLEPISKLLASFC